MKGETIKTVVLGSEEKYGYAALRIHRNFVRQALLKATVRAGIEIKYEMKCSSVEDRDDGTVVRFETGEVFTTKGLVVGADGMNSRVRESIAPGKQPKFDGLWSIYGFAKRDILKKPAGADWMRIIVGGSGTFAVIPCSEDEVLFFNTAETHDRSKEEWKALEADKEQLKELLKHPFLEEPWPDVVRELVTNAPAERYSCWP